MFLVLTIILSATILGMEIYQRLKLSEAEKKLNNTKEQVSFLHEEEILSFVLKNRLKSISSLNEQDSLPPQSFNLIVALMPADIRMLTFSIGKNGQTSFSGDTTNILALETFFGNLTDSSVNEGKIAAAKVDNLSRGANGNIRFDLTIILAGAKAKT